MQLGKWVHASAIPNEEDILADPTSFPFTPVIATILSPHIGVLAALIHAPESHSTSDFIHIPAFREMINNRISPTATLRSGTIPYAGDLTIIERARITNWFHCHVPGAQDNMILWMGRPALAHAFTLILHHRMAASLRKDPEYLLEAVADRDQFVLNRTWDFQKSNIVASVTDVDRECLVFFEEQMFEDSERAGAAGNWQWGLDAGNHQDKWNPYSGLPSGWFHGDRVGSEDELDVREQTVALIYALIMTHISQHGPAFIVSDSEDVQLDVKPRTKTRRVSKPPTKTRGVSKIPTRPKPRRRPLKTAESKTTSKPKVASQSKAPGNRRSSVK